MLNKPIIQSHEVFLKSNVMKKLTLIIFLFVFLFACSDKNGDKQTENEEIKTSSPDTKAQVDTMYLVPTVFSANVVSNGKVHAGEFADLSFRSPDIVAEVLVHNGQHVEKGQRLASLDTYKLEKQLKQNETDIAQAKLELQDVLIGQGFDPEKMSQIPAEVMNLARVRSGLDKAEASYQTTKREIEEAILKAPFSGVVANVNLKRHSISPASEPAMRIISDGTMSIEFPVLDSEIGLVKIGDTVDVMPFSTSETYIGRIVEINPVVDENGQIKIKANLDKSTGLIDGLNARVKINRELESSLVIPKSAVVLRNGRQVVFTLKDGKAYWNYVATGAENLDSYVVEDGLQSGQTVIINGNENLAHDSPVSFAQ